MMRRQKRSEFFQTCRHSPIIRIRRSTMAIKTMLQQNAQAALGQTRGMPVRTRIIRAILRIVEEER